MNIDRYIALAGLLINIVTAFAAIYIAFLALAHTAKPRISAALLDDANLCCDHLVKLRFELRNIGYWYALPPAIDITVFCDFDPIRKQANIGSNFLERE